MHSKDRQRISLIFFGLKFTFFSSGGVTKIGIGRKAEKMRCSLRSTHCTNMVQEKKREKDNR